MGAPAELAGSHFECPRCETEFTVPARTRPKTRRKRGVRPAEEADSPPEPARPVRPPRAMPTRHILKPIIALTMLGAIIGVALNLDWRTSCERVGKWISTRFDPPAPTTTAPLELRDAASETAGPVVSAPTEPEMPSSTAPATDDPQPPAAADAAEAAKAQEPAPSNDAEDPPVATQENDLQRVARLAALRAVYDRELGGINQTFETDTTQLQAQYVAALQTLQSKLQRIGDPAERDAVDAEIKRVTTEGGTGVANISTVPALRKLQNDNLAKSRTIAFNRCCKICKLVEGYRKHLRSLRKTLSLSGEVQQALIVNQELQRLHASEEVVESESRVAARGNATR